MVKKLQVVWAIEVVIILVLMVFGTTLNAESLSWITLPFTIISDRLRNLSLMNSIGNLVSIVLYILICASPLLLLRRKTMFEKILLILWSLGLFVSIYLFINLHLISIHGMGVIIQLGLTIFVYSIILDYGIVTLVTRTNRYETNDLLKILGYLLIGVGMYYVSMSLFVIKTIEVEQLASWINQIGILIPSLLGLFIIYKAVKIIDLEVLGETSIKHIEQLSKLASQSLIIMVVVNIGVNLLKLLLISSLENVSFSFNYSLDALLLVIVVMFVSRLMIENSQFI